MNTYEIKQQEKKERYQELAAKNASQASKLSIRGWDALSQIPFGQSILVGHHSERSDRAYRDRAVAMIGRSVEGSKKADYYAQKAESVGTAGISSDDPDAIIKLKEKLEKQQANHAKMKAEGKTGFYLSNSSQNMRATKKRIEQLEKAQQTEKKADFQGNGYILRENSDDNRIQFLFSALPNEEVRSALKSWGFRWSPINKAWQRQLNNAGRHAAKRVVENVLNQAI